jgi:para-nitrobenzyl esterase
MPTIVETGLGKVQGFEQDGVRVFRGIPFAKPPVGELRFRAPEKPAPWAGVRDATKYGPVSHQPPLMLAALPGFDVGEQSEDCLYLNVYVPAGASAANRKPVMVWIHGGAFVIGAGSQSIYDACKLVRRGDVVIVTINYRLGALGFLDLGQPELAAPNAGLLDQIAALEWVRDHIGAFGGDAGNVTIFGESAGGMSVGTLLGCPAARGLFHKAIPQSGSCQSIHADRESSSAVTAAILSGLGMATPNVKELRAVPIDKLKQVQQTVSFQMLALGGTQLLPFQPVVDGHVLPRHPLDEIREGIARDVRVLIGTTRDEWKLFGFMDPQVRQLDGDKIAERIQQRLPHADGAKIAAGYRATRPEADWPSIWIAIETDRIFRIPAIRVAEAQRAHQPDVFMYLFTWESPGFGGLLGACHAIEIPFLFDCLDLPGAEKFIGSGPDAQRLAERTMDSWLTFAKSGDPSHAALGAWPRYEESRRGTMELGLRCGVQDDPAAAERALWDGVL